MVFKWILPTNILLLPRDPQSWLRRSMLVWLLYSHRQSMNDRRCSVHVHVGTTEAKQTIVLAYPQFHWGPIVLEASILYLSACAIESDEKWLL